MLSLYLHIPFCHHKCGYCSFQVIPMDGSDATLMDNLKKNYLLALHQQIDSYASLLGTQSIKTIYFGGGTPSSIGPDAICELIDHIGQLTSLDYMEELSIEINPEPQAEMLDLIQTISRRYGTTFPRLRFSIGIQSFDNEVLADSKRQYTYQSAVEFLRALTPLKQGNVLFNIDFIAFGKRNTTRKGDRLLRDDSKIAMFEKILSSGLIESCSLYTLELFPGSDRYNALHGISTHDRDGLALKKYGTDDDVYEEFELLKDIILGCGMARYEISNFSFAGANSIHNRVYRSYGERLGLGTSASGTYTDLTGAKIRTVGTHTIADYIGEKYLDDTKTQILTDDDIQYEKIILALRTQEGLEGSLYDQGLRDKLFVDNRTSQLDIYTANDLMIYTDTRLALTDSGMNIYNTIVTELMK